MNRSDVIVGGLCSLALIVVLVPFARIGVEMHHDGIMLKPALDVLSGQVLFRDTFMQYGALTCYLQVLALWINPTLLCMKLQAVVAYGITLFFLYASWRLILPRSLAVLSCGLFIIFIPVYEKNWLDQFWVFLPWSSVFAMMFQSIGLYALFRIIRGEQPRRWGTVLGVACACVFWCRQPVGLVMSGCLIVISLALYWTNWSPGHQSHRSTLVSTCSGFLTVHVILLGGILFSSALTEWWYQNYIWPVKFATSGGSKGWNDFFTYYIHPEAGAILLAILLIAGIFPRIRRSRYAFSPNGVILCFICLIIILVWQRERLFQSFMLRSGGWTAFFPFLVLVQAIVSIVRAFPGSGAPKRAEYYLVAALSALSLGSLLQFYPRGDPWHMLWSLAPAFGLVVFVIWQWLGCSPRTLAFVVTAVFIPSLWVKVDLTNSALTQPLVTLVKPAVLNGMKVPPMQAQVIAQTMGILERVWDFQPNMPSAIIGDDAMYLCFGSNFANASPYFITWPLLGEKEDTRKRWNYILSVHPLMFFHKAELAAVDDFYRIAHYVPVGYVADEALEIAVPNELATMMFRPAEHKLPDVSPFGETIKR